MGSSLKHPSREYAGGAGGYFALYSVSGACLNDLGAMSALLADEKPVCMYACMYVCVCVLCMYVCYVCTYVMYVRMLCIYVCMLYMLCMYVCMYVYYICMYAVLHSVFESCLNDFKVMSGMLADEKPVCMHVYTYIYVCMLSI